MSELEQAALAAIALIIDHLRSAQAGVLDPKVALAAIAELGTQLAANAKDAADALAKKFPG